MDDHRQKVSIIENLRWIGGGNEAMGKELLERMEDGFLNGVSLIACSRIALPSGGCVQ